MLVYLLWPLLVSLFVFMFVFSGDVSSYCVWNRNFLSGLCFSGVDYIPESILGCIVYGSLSVCLVLMLPFLVLVFGRMNIERIAIHGMSVSLKSVFFVCVLMTYLYSSFFFSSRESYTERGQSFFDVLVGNYVAFYFFVVMFFLVLVVNWALYFKLLFHVYFGVCKK